MLGAMTANVNTSSLYDPSHVPLECPLLTVSHVAGLNGKRLTDRRMLSGIMLGSTMCTLVRICHTATAIANTMQRPYFYRP